MSGPKTMACPDCPDGNVWNADGPTGKACPTCGGHAALRLDGSRIDGGSRPVEPPDRVEERMP